LGNVIPTPALSASELQIYPMEWRKALKGYDLAWWTKDSLFKHDGLLVSYYYAYYAVADRTVAYDFRQYFTIRDDVLLICDSGGYEIETVGAELDPLDVYRWQAKNCKVAMALDVPLGRRSSTVDVPMEVVERRAQKTRRNVEAIARELEKREGLKFYLVLHGHKPEELSLWWRTAVEPYIHLADGVAVGYIPNRPEIAVMQLAFLARKEVKNVHIFMLFGKTALLAYYLKDYFNLITFDSAGYTKSAAMGHYVMPIVLSRVMVGRKGKVTYEIERLPCICPACQLAEEFNINILNPRSFVSYQLLKLHNVYTVLQVYRLADYDVGLVEGFVPENVKSAVAKWRDYYEMGEVKSSEGGIKRWL